jgi:D-glycero-D-manno-heptose 1,7-bisphosphate phosphatase
LGLFAHLRSLTVAARNGAVGAGAQIRRVGHDGSLPKSYDQLSDGFLDQDDVWCQVFGQRRKESCPGLFLDRDGVVVEWVPYLHRVQDVALIPGSAETIAVASRRGLHVVMVTNQAGIGRGYYGWKEFQEVQEAILSAMGNAGALIDGVFACPHHPEGIGNYLHPAHPSRKPEPGMLLRAADLVGIDLAHSWVIGDRSEDLLAGRAAGLQGGVLVKTGLGPQYIEAALALRTPSFEVVVANSIADAGGLIPLLA